MSSLLLLRRLFAHLSWADEHLIEALGASSPHSPVALDLLAHVLAAEHVWCARIRRQSPSVAVWPALTAGECAALAERSHAEFHEILNRADESFLAEEISYVNSAGAAFRSRIDDMLLQVATHGAYHRGQIALLLRQQELAPPPTDYIGFIRGAPAATRTITTLVPISRDGTPDGPIEELPEPAKQAAHATAELYRRVGFESPWNGYFVMERGVCVGTCAFTSPPRSDRVEIAYFTFPGHEGRGVATRAALQLIRIARSARANMRITAQTLPRENASTSILKKLGFEWSGEAEHSEDGIVWEWSLKPL